MRFSDPSSAAKERVNRQQGDWGGVKGRKEEWGPRFASWSVIPMSLSLKREHRTEIIADSQANRLISDSNLCNFEDPINLILVGR
ncbi:hypothetical protein HZH68_011921 [Vespula germanica]|uniref:Uncharacterized protein n=2 Tax=Vespula TaxID=7451 RepID=A0A834N045_VESGE|nr:hypothetical protein HZH66_010762 [Vespula vulgaris]KAF7390064.1 hypothetical protein HZH68_011921 [Vespula germanica]